jgi:alkylhydroperoxidase/carboxymuconolactone decarboxylase family protein YurZ
MTDQSLAEDSETESDEPVLDVLAAMTAASIERSNLDPETLMLVRLAALVAVDAPPLSYVLNLRAAGELGVSAERVRDVLAAVAPVVGAPRIVAAASKIARGVGIAIAVDEMAAEEDEG